ncbi:PTS ascorbate transporter subunit IIC [Brevibacillus daliensis]|uniref:PTS ascorbate transporter subunit IIC n=1 Tax=Brevibacillus daliensis TaxID=2892995 RepID=UPI001E614E2D|nr:PTS ascorbate transporter subunit IIC [Brevibacillus daliensis]
MNFSSLIDWSFFWNVFNNFLFSLSPFALIVVAAIGVGLVIRVLISAIAGAVKK